MEITRFNVMPPNQAWEYFEIESFELIKLIGSDIAQNNLVSRWRKDATIDFTELIWSQSLESVWLWFCFASGTVSSNSAK